MSVVVSAVVPAYNEADIIAQTIVALRSLSGVEEVIVVDDGSADLTTKEAETAGASKVIRLKRNLGKGAALTVGLREARGQVLLMVDADLGESARNLQPLLEAVVSDRADMAIAAPPRAQVMAGWGMARNLASWAIRKTTGFSPAAPLSGQRAFKRWVWEGVGKLAFGYGLETALTIDAHRCGARILELPILITHRQTTRDIPGIIHRGRQFFHILLAVVPRVALPSPLS